MGINLSMPATKELKPRIVVFGVGGAGGNAVNNMIASQLGGVEFVAANTDAQALNMSLTERRIQLGVALTQGLGCGAKPDIGRGAAEESMELIAEHLQGCHMAFVAAGMGGGTGTGAAPVIARAAKELGILTVGVVTKPFSFEGSQRMKLADAGIRELQQYVDTLIIIPNQNLFRIANEKTTFADAFKMADNVLQSGVRGITDLMVMPGLINLDFADVRAVMSEMGKAMMGTGEADGDHRAIEAAERAIANPLLDDISMKGARGVLINITGGSDLTLFEVDEAANRIREEVDPEANIIVGSTLDPNMDGRMRVSVVATGIDAAQQINPEPKLRLITPATAAQPRPAVQPLIASAALAPKAAAPAAAPAVAVAQAPVAQAVAAPVVQPAPAVAVSPELAQARDVVAAAPVLDPATLTEAAPAVEAVAPLAQPVMAEAPVQAAPAAMVFAPPAQAPVVAQAQTVQAPQAPAPQGLAPQNGLFNDAEVIKPSEGRKAISIIGRMFGRAAPAAAPAQPQQPVPQREPQFTLPQMTAPTRPMTAAQPESVVAPVEAAQPAAAMQPSAQLGAQPAAGGLGQPAPRAQQEDLLDIPAFLRRQAN
ncbi:cell division protein FtsZ [Ferrovibrio sp.]|uniref:cell division protein FtsZ n=1 Tax=Ferrovibrio sp. TaxID=1917215 RepID=UPI0025C6EBC5|nr:cell division protein FtsZ [Ferrovibrio sp.]MBX3455776.1 cell division protein FtsZ [Ferrovibrio sp.]